MITYVMELVVAPSYQELKRLFSFTNANEADLYKVNLWMDRYSVGSDNIPTAFSPLL